MSERAIGYANRYDQAEPYTDPRTWFESRPMFGSFGSWCFVMPNELDVELLGPRAAGWLAHETAVVWQESAIQEAWLR